MRLLVVDFKDWVGIKIIGGRIRDVVETEMGLGLRLLVLGLIIVDGSEIIIVGV